MKLINAILLFVSLMSFNAFAIRNVGNGGGLAEMRLIYLHQNLNRFLQICLTKENNCELSSQVQLEWQNLSAGQLKDSTSFVISFSPTKPENEKGYLVSKNEIIISSQMLYVDMEVPKKFGELLAYIIAVRLDVEGSANKFTTNFEQAKNIFSNMKIEESSYKGAGASVSFEVSQIKVFDGSLVHVLIALEDQNKAYNLSGLFTKAIPCGDLVNWKFNQWNSTITEAEGYFYGFASGLCEGVSVLRKVMIQFPIENKVINSNKIDVQFFIN
ncbi:MAG: hypothetical protein WA160_01455 [Pseudobdellovibrio sp.]